MGIPFWWVAKYCFPMWCVGLGTLLLMFFIVDYRNYLRAPKAVRIRLAQPPDEWRFDGLGNIFFLLITLVAVFINRALMVSGVKLQSLCNIRAAAPLTMGAAMLVPLSL